jgi:hypothetical protein
MTLVLSALSNPGTATWIDASTLPGPTYNGLIVYVYSSADFPTPVGDTHTLVDNVTYVLVGNIDLNGRRLVGARNTVLVGTSPFTSSLTSTGLAVGTPLYTSQWTSTFNNFTIQNVDTALALDDNGGLGAPLLVTWNSVHFNNVAHVGRLTDFYSLIADNCAFSGSQDLVFDGSFAIVCFFKSQLMGATTDPILDVQATASISECFRIIQSMITTPAGAVGIAFDVAATIPAEAYILDTVKFTGAGTYLTGVLSGTKTMFTNSPGIDNTSVNGLMYAQNNALSTAIGNTNDFFKVNIVTIPGTTNEKYLHSSDRLTNDSVTQRKYLVTSRVDFTTSPNDVVIFGVYDSTLGAVRPDSKAVGTANSGGRAEGVSFQTVVQQVSGDYVEVWVRNTSSTTAVVVTDLTLIVTEIG